MLKAVLIDDQKRELDGIRHLLPWGALGIEIVGEALNGRDGLLVIETARPDIVITDIVMPDMDGLGMLTEIMNRKLPVKVICISCFNEAKFISMAINAGASGYVLKPILARELEEVVCRVADEIRRQQQSQHFASRYDFLKGSTWAAWMVAAASLMNPGLVDTLDLQALDWPERFRVGFSEAMGDGDLPDGVLTMRYGHTGYVHFFLSESVAPREGICLGLSEPCTAEGFWQALAQAMADYEVRRGGEGPVAAQAAAHDDPFQRKLEIREVARRRDRKESMAFITACLPPMPLGALRLKARDLLVVAHTQIGATFPQEGRAFADFLAALAGCPGRQAILDVFDDYFDYVYSHGARSDGKEIVEQIQKRISDRMMDAAQLDMQALLEGIFVSPGYANVLFKHETGMTINQYIRTEKMAYAAKLLLLRPRAKVNDIAEACGFLDTAYFINVFKKRYGCTPAHFRAVKRGSNAGE